MFRLHQVKCQITVMVSKLWLETEGHPTAPTQCSISIPGIRVCYLNWVFQICKLNWTTNVNVIRLYNQATTQACTSKSIATMKQYTYDERWTDCIAFFTHFTTIHLLNLTTSNNVCVLHECLALREHLRFLVCSFCSSC